MANSNANASNVQWSGSNTTTLNTNNRVTSDAKSINADAVSASLLCSATNNGTPASGDVVDIWVAYSPDGTNYPTAEHAQWLCRINTYPTDDPGENPAGVAVSLGVSGKQSFKLVARAAQGASRSITISTVYNEHRMS